MAHLLSPASLIEAQRLLDCGALAAEAVEDREAIGVLIGDELVRMVGFAWVTIDDDYGSEPVVAHPHKMAVIAPLSAVTNRFEDGDVPFNIKDFIEEAIATVEGIEARNHKTIE
ncbi:DUF3806 domain-containing protein [Microvirga sp. TS319]|uniref:DUF3806 domain-containing protein n=1 Tax=Microvirga sp. TS319 TaxID=3241165 RepID=UPI00351A304A